MDSYSDKEIVENILKLYLPLAGDVRIVKKWRGGDNQHRTSAIICLSVEYEQDGKHHTQHMVLKIPTVSLFENFDFFNREVMTYEILVPRINDYVDSSLVPVHYHTTKSRILILENLATQGYQGLANYRLLPLQHCFPILKAAAEFHATSHIVYKMHPHLSEELIFQKYQLVEARNYLADAWEPIFCQLLEKNGATGLISKLAVILRYARQGADYIHSELHHSNFQFVVLNHGDFRKDNLMLKYACAAAPTKHQVAEVKILDLQTCTWSAPLIDLIYFFVTSVEIEAIDGHFDALVGWYLRCLNEKLREFNFAGGAYEKPNLEKDMKNFRLAAILGVMNSAIMLSNMDDDEITRIFSPQGANLDASRFVEDEFFAHIITGRLKLCDKLGLLDSFDAVNPE